MSKRLIKEGDVFQLGEHRLMCGDATNPTHVKELIQSDSISCILTDVPYGVNLVASKKGFTKSDIEHEDIINDHFQSDEEFRDFTQKWLAPVKQNLADKNTFYIFNSDRMMFPMRTALVEEGFKLSQLLIWVKTGAVIGRLDYLPQHELIAYGWYGKHKFRKSQDKSVLISPKIKKNNLHPTMKPLPILRRLILNTTERGSIVYDCFLGSGSTLIASEQTRRKCLGMELSPKYCETIITRWEKLTDKKSIKLTK